MSRWFLGQMSTLLFPFDDHIKLKNILYDKFNIEIPTYRKDGYVAFRISIQGYNDINDIELLVSALKTLLWFIVKWHIIYIMYNKVSLWIKIH